MLGFYPISTTPISSLKSTTSIKIDWLSPFNNPLNPIRQKTSGFFAPPDTNYFPENVSLDRWISPLSLPVLRTPKPQNWTGIFSAPYTVSYKETTTLDRWFVPFREPVRSIPKNASGFFAPPDTTKFAETPNVDKWYRNFDVPVLPKKKIIPPSFFYYDKDISLVIPPTMTTWFQAWREPVRRTQFIRQQLDQVNWYWKPIPATIPIPGKQTLSVMQTSSLDLTEVVCHPCSLSFSNTTNVDLLEEPL